MLAREFDPIDVTLTCWDFILGGAYTCFIQRNQDLLLPSLENRRNTGPASLREDFVDMKKIPPIDADPWINLDVLCTAMIIFKKPILMESDFSMSFATLLNYDASKE